MHTAPSWSQALQAELQADGLFTWLNEEQAERIKQVLLEGWAQFPLGDPAQSEGEARLMRSQLLALGPERSIRLTNKSGASFLLYDPQQSDRVFLSLGTNFPPLLWPSAAPSLIGIKEAFAAYLTPSFLPAAQLSRSLRLGRSSLEELGVESIERLAEIIAATESWVDGIAQWSNGLSTDPWPEDPSSTAMVELRVIEEDSALTNDDRFPSVSIRTLWSRSIITIEQGPFQQLVFQLRYEPAPFITWHPNDPQNELALPADLPADVMASLLRAPVVSAARIEEIMQGTIDPMLVLSALLLSPEPAQLEPLRALLRRPEYVEPAMQIAQAFYAFGLLGELEAETTDEALRARLAQVSRLHAPETHAEAT